VFTSSVHQRTLQRVRDVAFDGPVTVLWDKKRWRCKESGCVRRSFAEATVQVPTRARLTTRLAGAVLVAVTTEVRAVDRVATEYGLSWPTVARLVAAAAAALAAGPVALTRALGIDEHRFRSVRWFRTETGAWARIEPWSTVFTDTWTPARCWGSWTAVTGPPCGAG
jgi:transposase